MNKKHIILYILALGFNICWAQNIDKIQLYQKNDSYLMNKFPNLITIKNLPDTIKIHRIESNEASITQIDNFNYLVSPYSLYDTIIKVECFNQNNNLILTKTFLKISRISIKSTDWFIERGGKVSIVKDSFAINEIREGDKLLLKANFDDISKFFNPNAEPQFSNVKLILAAGKKYVESPLNTTYQLPVFDLYKIKLEILKNIEKFKPNKFKLIVDINNFVVLSNGYEFEGGDILKVVTFKIY